MPRKFTKLFNRRGRTCVMYSIWHILLEAYLQSVASRNISRLIFLHLAIAQNLCQVQGGHQGLLRVLIRAVAHNVQLLVL